MHWRFDKEIDHEGIVFWTFGPFQWIPNYREINWIWVKDGEWQSKTLLKY